MICNFAKKLRLQRFLAYILLLSLHVQPLYIVGIGIDFVVNNEYIREILCINKEQPELSCGGKCHLMKQIKESEPEQQDSNGYLTKIIKLEYVIFNFEDQRSNHTQKNFKKSNTTHIASSYTSPSFDIFHPPKIA